MIMDAKGVTAYVLDDTLPASDTIMWSSLKTSRFFWKNKITSGSTLATVTPFNTTTTLTIPFTGTAMVMSRGMYDISTGMNYRLNGAATTVAIARQSNTNKHISSNCCLKVKKGDTLVFTIGAPNTNFDIQVLQI